jgi:hypothetical protein
MQGRQLAKPRSGWPKVADRTYAPRVLVRASTLSSPGPRGAKAPYLLGDYEAARDPLQIFLLMLPNPRSGLGVA